MKKILKSFTFYFVLISFLIIYLHQIGQDSKSIVLISFNPILDIISKSDVGREFMNLGIQIPSRTILGSISIFWYIGSVITFIIYGLIFDLIKYLIKKVL